LKTKVLPNILYLALAVVLMSFSDPYTIKRISDLNFRYEFYTTDKTIKPKDNKIYYWFKGGLIHNAQGGTAGVLLDGKFVKMYHSNQLAELGEFNDGLKDGLWKTWYPNGVIETTQSWSNGLKSGSYYHYDENGVLLEKGKYREDIKHGQWIDCIKKDTLDYKKGIVLMKKVKPSKAEKAKLKADKKKANETKKALKKAEKAQKTNAKVNTKATKKVKETKKVSENKPSKESFFKKLFGKKQPKQNTNGQGA
jgi:hypothetical protein